MKNLLATIALATLVAPCAWAANTGALSNYDCINGGINMLPNTATGNLNVACGSGALQKSNGGNFNTAFGAHALTGATSGSGNTGMGYRAGDNITTGGNNIVIGNGAQALTATGSNTLNIGNLLYGNVLGATARSLMVGGGLAAPVSTLTATGAVTLAQHFIKCDATAGAVTISLPAAASAYNSTVGAGYRFVVKKIDASANNCTVQVTGGVTNIDGAPTKGWNTQYAAYGFWSDGTQYWIE